MKNENIYGRTAKSYFPWTNFKPAPFYLFADDFGYCEFFIAEESQTQCQVPLSGQWEIESSFSIPITEFEGEVLKIKRKYKRRKIYNTQRRLSRVVKNLPPNWQKGRLAQQNGDPLAIEKSNGFSKGLDATSFKLPVVNLGNRMEVLVKKKRGRPKSLPKVTEIPSTCQTTDIEAISENCNAANTVPEKKRRGRPKSILQVKKPIKPPSPVPEPVEKRKRGRPPKVTLRPPTPSPLYCNGQLTQAGVPKKKPGPKPQIKMAKAEYQPTNYLQRAVQRLRIIERDNTFLCNRCGRAFKNKRRCVAHQNVHRVWFRCVKCKKSYVNKRFLVRHEMIAHPEKPFKNNKWCFL